jgi:MFS transporter, DHA1 family, tetracycline resistance protein
MLKKNPFLVIFFTVFVDLLGVGILLPVIPLLLVDPRSEFYLLPHGYSLSQGFIIFGFLTAIYPFMQFIAAPILGQLSDVYGRKKVLAVALGGTTISYILFAIGVVTGNIPLLFFSRALDGITGGNLAVAQASIADISSPENRAKNFGLIGAAFGLGFIIGPFLGGILSDPKISSWFNAATPFWFAAGLSFINVLSVLLIFPETRATLSDKIKIQWSRSLRNILQAFGSKTMRPLFLTNFFFQGGFAFFTTFFSIFLITRFNYEQGDVGLYFAYVGLWIAITQGFITRFMVKRFTGDQIVRFSIIGAAIFTALFFLVSSPWQLFLLSPFHAIFIGLSFANIPALISRTAGPEIQGEVLGINTSVQALAQTIPPVLSGYIAARLSPTTPILTAVIVMLIGAVIFWTTYKRPQQA